MELASYYHSVFLQESLHSDYHNISLYQSRHHDLPGLPDSNTSDYESASSSPATRDPCWDLESLEDGDLYRLQEYSHLYRPGTDFILKTEPSACNPTPTTITPPTPSTLPKAIPSSCTQSAPSAQVLQRRRTAANARERKRMTRINTAFGRLRQILPGQRTNRELSKMEALQVAQQYILTLAELLRKTPA